MSEFNLAKVQIEIKALTRAFAAVEKQAGKSSCESLAETCIESWELKRISLIDVEQSRFSFRLNELTRARSFASHKRPFVLGSGCKHFVLVIK